jgi:hypothetical protein
MYIRVHGDATGETHLTPFELPAEMRTDDGHVMGRMLAGLPVTTLMVTHLSEKAGSNPFHATTPRKVIMTLSGAFRITTTDGDSHDFTRGHCLFTDDIGTKGHAFDDVGDEPLSTVIVEVGDAWQYPET